jgi:hypothetical protein
MNISRIHENDIFYFIVTPRKNFLLRLIETTSKETLDKQILQNLIIEIQAEKNIYLHHRCH